MSKKYESRIAMRRCSLEIRGVEYSICEWGNPDAPMFFYFHGWADCASTFQFVIDALQSNWFVVAPDWRGFGHSQHADASYWFPDYIADLHSILEAYSRGSAACLVGHSMGGNVASLYAGVMPERVSAFVNIEGFGLSDSDPEDAPLRLREWIDRSVRGERYSEYASFELLAKKIQRRSSGMSLEAANFVARQWACQDDDGVVRLRADAKHKLPNPILYRRAEAAACARAITARTLLISGSDSPFATYSKTRPALAPQGHDAATIDGVGHMPHFESPCELALQIERFFNKAL